MRLGRVAVNDFEDDRAGFLFDVIKQILRRVQYVEKEVGGFFFLDAIAHREGDIAASNFRDILPMNPEGVCVAAESNRVLPSDPRQSVSNSRDCAVG